MAKKVLLVEDDRDIRDCMIEFLQFEGYEVLVACNGQEALDLLKEQKEMPIAILLDLMMPVMDGFKFAEERKKIPKLAEVPVILMTANSNAEAHMVTTGAKALLRKPVDIDDVAKMLSTI
jgi:two-component system, chemotaxis family, chemotaxis protein CheY